MYSRSVPSRLHGIAKSIASCELVTSSTTNAPLCQTFSCTANRYSLTNPPRPSTPTSVKEVSHARPPWDAIGGGIGGALCLAILLALYATSYRRRRRNRKDIEQPKVLDPTSPEKPPSAPSTPLSVSRQLYVPPGDAATAVLTRQLPARDTGNRDRGSLIIHNPTQLNGSRSSSLAPPADSLSRSLVSDTNRATC